MTSPNIHILELTPPELVDHHTSYIRDALRWGFSAHGTSTTSFRGGNPSQSLRSQTGIAAEGTLTFSASPVPYAFESFKEPQIVHPIRAEVAPLSHYGPPDSKLEPSELPLCDIASAHEYTAKVEISRKSFRVQIDTGSSSRWVFGENYNIVKGDLGKVYIPWHTVYSPGSNARCHGRSRFEAKYSDGSHSKGPIYEDVWKFTTQAGSYLAVDMIFGAATEVHEVLASSCIDGILGLNFAPPHGEAFANAQPDSILVTLVSKRLISSYMFCICMDRSGPSFLSLGGIPPELPGPSQWIAVPRGRTNWIIPCKAFGWGVSPTQQGFQKLTLQPHIDVLVDTGTTLCYFPNEVLDFVYSKLEGRKMTDRQYLLPDQHVATGGKQIWIELGGMWILWNKKAFYGPLKHGSTNPMDDGWYDGQLLSKDILRIQCSILGAVFLEHINVHFDADLNAPKVAFTQRR